MAITLVAQTLGIVDNATSPALDTTGANLLVANLGWYTSNAFGAAMSDSKGNTWTPLISAPASYVNRMFYCLNPTVGPGHTFAATSYSIQGHMSVRAFSGVASLVEGKAFAHDAPAVLGNLRPGTVTPTLAGSLVVTGLTCASSTVPTLPAGFTGLATAFDGAHQGGGSAHLIQAAAAAIDPLWTWTPTAVNWGAASVAAFAPAASSPATLYHAGGAVVASGATPFSYAD